VALTNHDMDELMRSAFVGMEVTIVRRPTNGHEEVGRLPFWSGSRACGSGCGVLVLLLGGGEDTQMATSPVDQGSAARPRPQIHQGRTPARRPKPGERYVVIDTHATTSICGRRTRCSWSGVLHRLGDTLLTLPRQHWVFNTPRRIHVTTKIVQPWWRKPDWAYIEEGSNPAPSKDEERLDPAMMGDYALGFGDGYFIHGTSTRDCWASALRTLRPGGRRGSEELYKQVESARPSMFSSKPWPWLAAFCALCLCSWQRLAAAIPPPPVRVIRASARTARWDSLPGDRLRAPGIRSAAGTVPL